MLTGLKSNPLPASSPTHPTPERERRRDRRPVVSAQAGLNNLGNNWPGVPGYPQRHLSSTQDKRQRALEPPRQTDCVTEPGCHKRWQLLACMPGTGSLSNKPRVPCVLAANILLFAFSPVWRGTATRGMSPRWLFEAGKSAALWEAFHPPSGELPSSESAGALCSLWPWPDRKAFSL